MRHISLQILLNIPKWEENDHQNSNLSHNGRNICVMSLMVAISSMCHMVFDPNMLDQSYSKTEKNDFPVFRGGGYRVTKTLHYADQGGEQSEHLTRNSIIS